MRARYSAFVTGAIDFIVDSTHSRTRKEVDIDFVREWSQTSEWRGLQIFETKQVNDNKAFVSFEAQYTQNGKEQTHREKSLFEREDGEWRFVTGDELKNPTVGTKRRGPAATIPARAARGRSTRNATVFRPVDVIAYNVDLRTTQKHKCSTQWKKLMMKVYWTLIHVRLSRPRRGLVPRSFIFR